MLIKDYKLLIELEHNPYGTNAFKVCKIKILSKCKWLILIFLLIKIKKSIIQSCHILQMIHSEY